MDCFFRRLNLKKKKMHMARRMVSKSAEKRPDLYSSSLRLIKVWIVSEIESFETTAVNCTVSF